MTALESQVSRGLMRMRMVERALHDQKGWGIHCAGVNAPASIEVLDDRVRLTAVLPGLCSIGDEFPIIDITKDDDVVLSVRLDGPLGEHGTNVLYEFGSDGVLVDE